jgi:FlaG/FlaF family flagellin (archaellin)
MATQNKRSKPSDEYNSLSTANVKGRQTVMKPHAATKDIFSRDHKVTVEMNSVSGSSEGGEQDPSEDYSYREEEEAVHQTTNYQPPENKGGTSRITVPLYRTAAQPSASSGGGERRSSRPKKPVVTLQ